jgi:protease II
LNSSSLVYLRSEADHRYNSLWIWSYKTGEHKKLYEISDPTKNLALRRLENGSVAVVVDDFINEELGFIYETHVEWYKPNMKKALVMAFDHHTVLVNPIGSDFHRYLPNDFLEAASKSAGWAITRSYGIRTLWDTHARNAKAMIYVWGEITYDSRDPTHLSVCDVRYEPYTVIIKGSKWSLTKTKAYPFVCSYYNTKAPTFVVSPNNTRVKPRGLLVTAYGAYGFPTKIGRIVRRWRPLLEAGWAIASVAVPGSGDHDLAWRFAGQRTKRKLAVDTLVAAVRDLQEELGIPAQVTALYGRSAGGLLVTAVVAEDPKLVGALYIESPYVDALRTLTNPRFPLTVLESNEFGIGTNPVDVISLARWSPMERIPAKGYPNLFVVARTDMSDLEVYPYEPLKYVTRVRGQSGSQPKLIYISSDQGHFTTTDRTRAEDLALLDEFVNK